MIRTGIRWMAAATLVLATAAAAQDAPKDAPGVLALGKGAPRADVKMANVDGKSLSIADAKGAKGTLVVFTCNTCPFARAWQARIAELGNTYLKQGIGVIAINSNDPAVSSGDDMTAMQDRAKMLELQFPYVVDASSDVARAFGATRTPEVFLFDARGKLVYHGAVDDNRDADQVQVHWLNDALAATVTGKAVPVRETKSIGCTIKFRAKSTSS